MAMRGALAALGAVMIIFILAVVPEKAAGAGECGRVSAERMAFKLLPCAAASRDADAAVSSRCCAQVHTLGQNPACLCAVMLSDTARSAGVQPAVAITIPKRCELADRPVGYKCGDYTLP